MAIGKDLVTVVVPTFNEEEAIGLVLDELLEVGYRNVLVVDGYSVDGTVRVAESMGVRVVLQNGRGKTGTLKIALETLCSMCWLWLLRGFTSEDESQNALQVIDRLRLQILWEEMKGISWLPLE